MESASHLASPHDETCGHFAGGGRVLKTLLCVHDQGGLVVVKVAANVVEFALELLEAANI